MTRIIILITLVALVALPALAEGASGKVNLNEATLDQLQLLPRIGPAIGKRIIEFRKEHGPFKKVEEIMHVRGIGEKTFALIKPYLTLEGPTTLRSPVRVARRGN